MSIYTVRFFAGNVAAGAVPALTVPAGKVWVVRELDIVETTGSQAGYAELLVAGIQTWRVELSASPPYWRQWTGAHALRPGETLQLYNATNAVLAMVCSGYEFIGP